MKEATRSKGKDHCLHFTSLGTSPKLRLTFGKLYKIPIPLILTFPEITEKEIQTSKIAGSGGGERTKKKTLSRLPGLTEHQEISVPVLVGISN